MFRGMNAAQIKSVLAGSDNYTVSKFAKGDVIARRDQTYSGLMILLRGSAEGRMTLASGKAVTIDSIEAPQLIAPAFLFGGYNRLPVDVVALSEGELMTLHRGFIFEMMQQHTLILSNFIDILSDRANVWSRKIYFLSFRSLKEKVATFLLHGGGSGGSGPSGAGSGSGAGDRVEVGDMSHMAESMGVTRSSLQRVLDVLVDKHIIAIDKGSIVILNRSAIEGILK